MPLPVLFLWTGVALFIPALSGLSRPYFEGKYAGITVVCLGCGRYSLIVKCTMVWFGSSFYTLLVIAASVTIYTWRSQLIKDMLLVLYCALEDGTLGVFVAFGCYLHLLALL